MRTECHEYSQSWQFLPVLVLQFPRYEFDVLVESEDGAGQQERLRHVVEQSRGHVVDADNLVGNQCDAADDEQHRTGILGGFEAIVFHGIIYLTSYIILLTSCVLHHHRFSCGAEYGSDDVTDNLKNSLKCLVHGFVRLDC